MALVGAHVRAGLLDLVQVPADVAHVVHDERAVAEQHAEEFRVADAQDDALHQVVEAEGLQTGAQRERRGGIRAFAKESWGELKKVEWPGRRQLLSATAVVIIAVAVVGAYLYVLDEAISRLVRDDLT